MITTTESIDLEQRMSRAVAYTIIEPQGLTSGRSSFRIRMELVPFQGAWQVAP